MKLKGKITKGKGAANWTIPLQKEFFREYVEDIDRFYNGTINLSFETPLIILKPEIETKPIPWFKGVSEKFGFVRVKLEIETAPNCGKTYDALIYVPYDSPHRSNPFQVEILAPFIDLTGFQFCNIIIEKDVREIQGFVIESVLS